MSEYQVIARKWRPQSFSDVVGQEHVVRTLRNAISSGRIAHAYLFVGPHGIGKTTLARIFAKALNCETPVNGEPCCKCSSCLEAAAERSLDILEIDAASRNSTADMRELAENALTRPVTGKYKIYIIDEVHMLSKAAWNVLLKTVEEPPAHVKFIFATTEVHQVLPTIISRCQRFDLMPIPTGLIAERLKLIADTEKVAINPAAVNAIARAAEGGMRDAQSLLDQMIAFFAAGDGSQITEEQVLSLFGLTDKGDLNAILQAVLLNNPGEVVTRIAMLAGKGKNLETLFDDILYAMRAIQMCTILADPSLLLDESSEAIADYRKMAQLAPRDTIQILLENIAPVGRTLHDALNKQVYLETILLKAMREAHAVRIGDILARLNQLRSAGELQFIEQLPVVERNFSQAAGAVPISEPAVVVENNREEKAEEPVKEEETVPPAEPIAEVAEPVVEPEEIPVEVDNTAAEDNVAAAVVEEVVEEEDNIPEDAPAEEDVPVETLNEEESVSAVPALAKDDSAGEVVASYQEFNLSDDIDSDTEYDNLDTFVPPPVFLNKKEKEEEDSYAPDKLQKSIANDNPSALNEVLEKNPAVREAVDLFSGMVIDIHR